MWRISSLWPTRTCWPLAYLGTECLTEICCGMRRLLRSTLTPSGEPTHLFRLAEEQYPASHQIHLSICQAC